MEVVLGYWQCKALASSSLARVRPRVFHAQTLDPYHDYPSIPDEYNQVGREHFARAPGSDVWINFGDLPQVTKDALWAKYGSKLAFPAGFFDVDTVVSPH